MHPYYSPLPSLKYSYPRSVRLSFIHTLTLVHCFLCAKKPDASLWGNSLLSKKLLMKNATVASTVTYRYISERNLMISLHFLCESLLRKKDMKKKKKKVLMIIIFCCFHLHCRAFLNILSQQFSFSINTILNHLVNHLSPSLSHTSHGPCVFSLFIYRCCFVCSWPFSEEKRAGENLW